MNSSITPLQCRLGRSILGWSPSELADEAGVPLNAIILFERGDVVRSGANVVALRQAMEAAGVVFHGTDGVRLVAS